MTSVPLGRGAYERKYGGTPEVKLLNRWLEPNPANLREGSSVLARPGTTEILGPLDPGTFEGLGAVRGLYVLNGLFNDALFAVVGSTLYRIDEDMTVTPIIGTINGTGYPEVGWQKGAGYEQLWISDGLLLQFYNGPTHATGTLTLTGTIVDGTDKFEIGGVYYVWGSTFSSLDAGTNTHPYVINPLTSDGGILDPMNQLVLAIMDSGSPGVDYSGTIGGPNTEATAKSDGLNPAVAVTFSSVVNTVLGDLVTFTIVGGSALTATGTGTLVNGGLNALQGCTIPGGLTPISITQVSSFLLVAISNSQQFYWVNPGDTTIDALDFASKESSPDNIVCMRAVGDQVLIMGEQSTENWYATGNSQAPFAPVEGRVYARGVITGTPVVVDDGVILVGNDGRVYNIGYAYGDNTDAQFGVNRVSNNGIEERIRYQLRREAGLTP